MKIEVIAVPRVQSLSSAGSGIFRSIDSARIFIIGAGSLIAVLGDGEPLSQNLGYYVNLQTMVVPITIEKILIRDK